MKWLEDAPDDWRAAPSDPPPTVGDETTVEGDHDAEFVVRESEDAYIYAWSGVVSVEDRA